MNFRWPGLTQFITLTQRNMGQMEECLLNILIKHASKTIIRVRNKPAPWLILRLGNRHFTQIGSDLAEKIPASSMNPEDYLR